MASELLDLFAQVPSTGVAVGGALLAVALGFTAMKTFSGSSDTSGTAASSSTASKKKKTKSSSAKKKGSKKKSVEVEAVETESSQKKETPEINYEDFVAVRMKRQQDEFLFIII